MKKKEIKKMDIKKTNKPKKGLLTIKIGEKEIALFESVLDLVLTCIIVLFFIIYFLSPNSWNINTSEYKYISENDKKEIDSMFGPNNTEDRYNLYFQYFNVIHELGHGLCRIGNPKISGAEEEQLVDDFAIAYWKYYGEAEKVSELEDIIYYANSVIKDPTDGTMNYMEFAKKNWNKSSFYSFANYGWFQFEADVVSLESNKTLEDVLKEMGIKDIKVDNKKLLEYDYPITEEISNKIVQDAVDNFREWGIDFPDVHQKFLKSGGIDWSNAYKNFLGTGLYIPKIPGNI